MGANLDCEVIDDAEAYDMLDSLESDGFDLK